MEPWPSKSLSTPFPEDSYEAALRAADALFSGRPRQPAAASSVEPTEALAASAQPVPAGGRILRAIDESPPPELVRLEAEVAPKRRGRKPGSKNKPKIVPPVVEDALATARPAPASVASAPSPVSPVIESARVHDDVPDMRSVGHVFVAASVPAVARGERYAWVRTRLKPGQQWKRRLPKVAW